MTKRRGQLLRGGATLMVGEAVVQCCGLLRNFLVARFLLPDQFGIAAALAMSVSLVEMLSDLGAGRFLTRAHDEDGEQWLRVANGISVIRGALGGVLLVLLAGPLARLMSMPEATWAFRVVGLVPCIRGLTHNQIWLAQRELRFRAFVAVQGVPQVLTALAALPLAWWLRDYRALLWLLIANAALAVILSHIVARKPYRVAYDRDKVRQLLAFGLPLLGDGVLMFAVLHGERIVIANNYGTTLLGAYSAAFLLAWTPSAILGRVGLSLGVPQLASLKHNRPARNRQYAAGVQLLAAPALGMVVLFAFAGPEFVSTIFGENYALTAAFAAWLGIGQALRILRTFPVVVAIAEGFTLSAMVGNMARAAAVGVGWLLATRSGVDPWVVLAVGAGGELAALSIVATVNRVKLGVPSAPLIAPMVLVGLGFAAAWWAGRQEFTAGFLPMMRAVLGVVLGGLATLAVVAADPHARALVSGFLKHRRPQSPMTAAQGSPPPEVVIADESQ